MLMGYPQREIGLMKIYDSIQCLIRTVNQEEYLVIQNTCVQMSFSNSLLIENKHSHTRIKIIKLSHAKKIMLSFPKILFSKARTHQVHHNAHYYKKYFNYHQKKIPK